MHIDTITINKCEFDIEFVDKKDERMVMNDIEYDGLCFRNGLILVKKYEKDWVIKNTLLHELTHAFLQANGYWGDNSFSEENICEIIANMGECIVECANDIMNEYYKIRKGDVND